MICDWKKDGLLLWHLQLFFMLGFLPTWIACHSITIAFEKVMAGPRQRRKDAAELQREAQADYSHRREIFDKFQTLTDWQKHFLESCFNRGTPQVDRVEIGQYEVVWRPEIEVLIDKCFVRKINYYKYEILPDVWRFMHENIDRERAEMYVNPPNDTL